MICYSVSSPRNLAISQGPPMRTLLVLMLLGAWSLGVPPAKAAAPIDIVAAENFYGDVAQQIGGPQVKVTSILSNPDQDPHLFEASPSVARGAGRMRGSWSTAASTTIRGWRSCSAPAKPADRHGHRRRRPGRPEDRRQPAYLVRPDDHAGAGEGADRGAGRRRSGARGGLSASGSRVRRSRCSRSRRRSPRCARGWPACR